MAFEGAKAMLGEAVVKQLLRYLTNKPEENLVKILQWGKPLRGNLCTNNTRVHGLMP